ncbi:hypothetical protein EK21DRAFT_78881 [Setomelanomma holmii]|uniref:Uncharacterized protein n=1 Tax=Setomelanomma holmii TaxID=210430 RepID=A0A9P4GX78_9PLEO|nr:hypothetical protein EK21DRAFT_78881 [Setomelanomma holmii]
MPLHHSPSPFILIWTSILIPFLTYDSAYIFLRPHSFSGGAYAHYFSHMREGAAVDKLYSEAAWRAGDDGAIVAQGVLACVEVGLFCLYLGLVVRSVGAGGLVRRQMVGGREGPWAVLVGFTAGVLDVIKTGHYFLREVSNGFRYTGHNEPHPLMTGWGIFMYLWMAMNCFVMVRFGRDILRGLNDGEGLSEQKKGK